MKIQTEEIESHYKSSKRLQPPKQSCSKTYYE